MVRFAFGVAEFELAHAGEDEETGAHPEGADGEAFSTAEFLDHVEAWEGADYVYGAEDDLRYEGVLDAN